MVVDQAGWQAPRGWGLGGCEILGVSGAGVRGDADRGLMTTCLRRRRCVWNFGGFFVLGDAVSSLFFYCDVKRGSRCYLSVVVKIVFTVFVSCVFLFPESWVVRLQNIAHSLNSHREERIFCRNILHLSYVEGFLLHLKRFEDAVLSRKKRGR